MSELRWLRLWTDVVDDPKLLLLAPSDRWHYVAILALKRTGMLDEPDSAEMLDRKVGLRLRLDDRERDELRRRLMDVRLVDQSWQPAGWGKRQFPSDQDSTAAARQKRFRNRQRNALVTRDVPVTGNGQVTRPDTEQIQSRTETEKEQEGASAPPPGLDLKAWEEWNAYRVAIKKPIRPVSRRRAQEELAGFGSQQGEIVAHSIANGYQGLFAPKTAGKPKSKTSRELEAKYPGYDF